jgi:hypothetical protein
MGRGEGDGRGGKHTTRWQRQACESSALAGTAGEATYSGSAHATVRFLPTFAKVLLASLVHVRVLGLQRTSPQSSGVRAALAMDPRFEAQWGGPQASARARRAVRRRKRALVLCGPAARPGPLARQRARCWKRPSPCASVPVSLSGLY